MAGRKYSADTVAAALDMRAAGLGYARIARELGMSNGAVYYHCLAAGVVPDGMTFDRHTRTRTPVVRRGNHVVRLFTPAEDARIEAMRIAGATIAAIARKVGRPPVSVRSRLQTLARRDEVQVAA